MQAGEDLIFGIVLWKSFFVMQNEMNDTSLYIGITFMYVHKVFSTLKKVVICNEKDARY